MIIEGEEFRMLMCGSRGWTDRSKIEAAFYAVKHDMGVDFERVVVHHGGARGADRLCAEVGRSLGCRVVQHLARWRELGKAAGFERNARMLAEARPHLAIGFVCTDADSPGTRMMLDLCRKEGVLVMTIVGFEGD